MHHAAKRGLESIVKLLLLHGGMVKCLYFRNGLNFRDSSKCYYLLIWDLLFKFPANPLLMNDDCQTPLEVARAKGNSNVVRVIEVAFKLFLTFYYCGTV